MSAVTRIVLFSQPGCLSCELTRVFLEAHQLTFEERDVNADAEARRELVETFDAQSTPLLVIVSDTGVEVIEGFDPERLDRALSAA